MNFFKKLTGLSAGLLFFMASLATPVSAAGLTAGQVSAIVSLLQSFNADASVIQSVQTALGGSAMGTPLIHPVGCGYFSKDLSVGSTDTATYGMVSMLQQIVGVSPTGYFGSLTKASVQKWQAAHGVSATGYVGPDTRAKLACQSMPPATFVPTATSSVNATTTITTVNASTSPFVANIPSLFGSSTPTTTAAGGSVSQSTKDMLIGIILAEQKIYASSDVGMIRAFLISSTADEPTLSASYKSMTDDQISKFIPIMHQIATGIPSEAALRAPTTAWQVTDTNASILAGGTTVTLKKINGVWY